VLTLGDRVSDGVVLVLALVVGLRFAFLPVEHERIGV